MSGHGGCSSGLIGRRQPSSASVPSRRGWDSGFRRSFKIAPGLRLNTSLRGLSLSAGVRGAGVNIGGRGLTSHVGVPGTGMSYRSSSGGGRSPQRPASGGSTVERQVSISVLLEDDGAVRLALADGTPLTPAQVKNIRAQQGEAIAEMLDRACERWNQGIDELLTAPGDAAARRAGGFSGRVAEAEPSLLRCRPLGLLGRIFRKRRERIEEENRRAAREHEAQLEAWRQRRREHQQAQAQLRWLFEVGRHQDPQAMQQYLEQALSAIAWPRETAVSAEVEPAGLVVWLDVDLPELEHMPTHSATVATRGLKVNIKEKPEKQRRRNYLTHVHAVAFRLIGEAFAALPISAAVVLSGYTQRPDRATGHAADVYVLSIRVARSKWRKIRFDDLGEVDPVEALGRFDCRREIKKGLDLAAIEPFEPSGSAA